MNEAESKWYIEVIERLARLEAKLDHVNEVRDTADRADRNAAMALQKAQENADDIAGIRTMAKWSIGIVLTAALGVLAIIFH